MPSLYHGLFHLILTATLQSTIQHCPQKTGYTPWLGHMQSACGVRNANILENGTCLKLVSKQNRKTTGLKKKEGLLIWTAFVTPHSASSPSSLFCWMSHTGLPLGKPPLSPPPPPTTWEGGLELSLRIEVTCKGVPVTIAFWLIKHFPVNTLEE